MTARRFLPALAVAFIAGTASAQESSAHSCRDDETIDACIMRLVNSDSSQAVVARMESQTQAEERARLQRAATGVSLSSAGVQSSIRDFNPRLAATVLTPSLTKDGSAIGLHWNIPRPKMGTFQVGAVLNSVEVFKGLLVAVPDAQRGDVRTRLQERLSAFDDVSLTGALNVENAYLGRSFTAHQHRVDAFFRDARGQSHTLEIGRQLSVLQGRMVRNLNGLEHANPGSVLRGGNCPTTVAQAPMRCLRDGIRRDSVEGLLLLEAEVERAREDTLSSMLKTAGFASLAELVNNQPQLNVTFEYRVRAGAAGPDQWSGHARFETGFANMNALRRYCRSHALVDTTVACLQAYTRRPRAERSLERGHRLWASVSALNRIPFHYELTAPALSINAPRAWQFEVSGGYGVYLNLSRPKDLRDHLDLQATFKAVRDDPIRQNQFVATGSYTYRLSDETAGTIGITYANRPEFLGDVDRRFGANIGLTVKLPQGDPK